MKFTNAVRLGNNWLLKKLSNTPFWAVCEPFFWYVEYGSKKDKITVPEWFLTDMWSIPRLLWIFFDKTKYISFILHDYLCSNTKYNRKQADLILLEALRIEWASIIERICIYIWVRIGAMFWIGKK